jgi:hypothetical protein
VRRCNNLRTLNIPEGTTITTNLDVRFTELRRRDVVALRTRYPGIVLSDFDASFNEPNNQQIAQNVGGQEALVQQRETVTKTYTELATNKDTAHLIDANLPKINEATKKFKTAADDMEAFLTQALDELKLKDVRKFELTNAVKSLKLLKGDSSIEKHIISSLENYESYEYKGLPNIRQLFVLAYNLLYGRNVEVQQKEFVVAYLADADKWKVVKEIFNIGGTLAEELEKPNNVVNILCSFLANGNGLSARQTKSLYKNTQISNDFALARLDKLNPLIAALFMIMRGHNTGLEDRKEKNKPACAEGAYLNIMKVLAEIKQTKDIMGDISGIQIKLCDGSTTSVR